VKASGNRASLSLLKLAEPKATPIIVCQSLGDQSFSMKALGSGGLSGLDGS